MESSDSVSVAEKQLNPSLTLAIAMAVLRSRRQAVYPSHKCGSTTTTAVSAPVVDIEVNRWKRKAKERKLQLLKMGEELKEAEDALRHDVFIHNAPCKCFFFNDLGKSSVVMVDDHSDDTFNDVLHRRFLRQVRLDERRRKHDDSISKWRPSDTTIGSEDEKLRAAVDFLVNLCEKTSCARMREDYFANWAHQAADFIIVSLKKTMSTEKSNDAIEVTINSLITCLLRRMCSPLQQKDLYEDGVDARFHVQHLIRKIGSNSLLGYHTMLLVCERISVLGESLLFIDPLEDSFVDIHSSMFLLMELLEYLVLDYVGASWSDGEGSSKGMGEELVTSVVHTRDGLKVIESRNVLYVLYMDRVVGLLGRKLRHLE